MRDLRGQLKWCLSQSRGLKLVRPSENLVRGFLEKSRSALKSMDVNAEAGVVEWAVSASYYAKYFAVYSLLSRIGVKSEIHDCTIAVFQYLFSDHVSPSLIREFRRSKEDRIEIQYYTRQVRVDVNELTRKTKSFVLEIEKTADSLNSERIAMLQRKLREFTEM